MPSMSLVSMALIVAVISSKLDPANAPIKARFPRVTIFDFVTTISITAGMPWALAEFNSERTAVFKEFNKVSLVILAIE